jgi:glutathione S-transferase
MRGATETLPELWQAEWCLASGRVRERLTELGIDFVARQVPVERTERTELRRVAGSDTIPALRLASGAVLVGEEPIRRHLDERAPIPAEAEAHVRKAAGAHRRHLEEACACSQPATR